MPCFNHLYMSMIQKSQFIKLDKFKKNNIYYHNICRLVLFFRFLKTYICNGN